MSKPVPISDAALLAAQAKAGQAGVDAYEAAKQELQQARRGAVKQAMSEAAGRGGPAEAARSVADSYTRRYDDRIASLTSGQASYEGSMAARSQRLADYNDAVGSARGLIDAQAAQAAAPINAQADMQVRLTAQQGQNAVDEIMAKLRLQEMQMEAAAAAAARRGGGGGGRGGGGGGSTKKPSMNQTELRAMLTRPGASKIAEAAGTAQQAVKQGVEDRRDAVVGHRGTAVAKADYGMRQDILADALRTAADMRGKPVFGSDDYETGRTVLDRSRGASQIAAEQRRQLQNMATVPGVVTGPEANAFESIVPRAMLGEMAASPLAPLYDRLAGQLATPNMPAEQLFGQPDRDGQINSNASEAMREAMILAAIDLQAQGYEITVPELEAALDTDATWKAGSTAADVLNRAQGLDDVRTEQDAAISAEEQARADLLAQQDRLWTDYTRKQQIATDRAQGEAALSDAEKEALEADREAVGAEFFNKTGVPAAEFTNVPVEALATTVLDERFDKYAADVLAQVSSGDIIKESELVEALVTNEGIDITQPRDRLMIEILVEMVRGQLSG